MLTDRVCDAVLNNFRIDELLIEQLSDKTKKIIYRLILLYFFIILIFHSHHLFVMTINRFLSFKWLPI